jgi:subtilisin-like proprotein convertase family protein
VQPSKTAVRTHARAMAATVDRVRRTVLMWSSLVLACGEIREVMVAETGTGTSGTSDSTGASDSDGGNEPSSTTDIDDQDDTSSSVGDANDTTGDTGVNDPARDLFCGGAFGIGPDLEEGEDTIVVDDTGTIADLDVSLRMSHEAIPELEITLIRDDATVVLLEPGTVRCAAQLDGMFDDEAPAPEDGCGVVDELGVVRLVPSQALAGFDGESIAGEWRLAIAPADAAVGDVTGWCLVAELE